MASAWVNNIGMSPENFLDCPPTYPSYGWLSPRVSFGRDFPDEESKIAEGKVPSRNEQVPEKPPEKPDLDISCKDVGDFEFRLHDDPVTMLPADELFLDGKLVPLQLTMIRPTGVLPSTISAEVRSPETAKSRRRIVVSDTDPYLFSPKAPRCSSRWRELLGLKKLQNQQNKHDLQQKTASLPSKNHHNPISLKHFLHRNPKSSSSLVDSSMSLPLLRDSDMESVSISSRPSLSSSSSSGPDHEDLPRFSLDSEKPNISFNKNPPRVRIVKPKPACNNHCRPFSDHPPTTRVGRSSMRRASDSTTTIPARGVSVDSPRMNSSGKIVFQSLERSSSSPSSFNGGPRTKHHRGMERSYSVNVRVLNVPVCSLRGFGPLFSSVPQKRDGITTRNNNSRNHRTDRI